MSEFYMKIGDAVSFTKTIGETDVYLFAGITGDFSPNHVDEETMKRSAYGRRIMHGALGIGFMSTTSTMMTDKVMSVRDAAETPVSLGYDRIRFLKAIFLGDTITVTYKIAEIDPVKRRSLADVEIRNQDGELCTVAQHILKWVPKPTA